MSIDHITKTINRVFRSQQGVDYVLLFGSAASNKLRRQSDVDIFVGGRMTFGQRSKVMAQLHILLKRDIDIVLCQDAANDVALNAYAKGIKVMVRDQERLKSDYFKHYHAYDDAQYLRTIKAQKIKRNFSGQ